MIGKTLSHYRIVDKIGKGGMGEVYKAEDTNLHRHVALKVLPPEMAEDPDRLERFRREAQAIAALNHPNIVTIHSIEDSEAGQFITMELVEGHSLDEMITADGLSLEGLLEIAEPLVKALSAAHQKGITHRDLKPANVMVTADGVVKILDFGLAKLQHALESAEERDLPTQALTQEGMVVGTVPYMSPEQVQGMAIDHRTDIFSVGVILYEMATGKRPFKGESSASLISAILRDTPPAVTELRGDVPRDLARVIGLCLEKEPKRRYQAADEVLEDLAKIGGEKAKTKEDTGRSVAVLPFVDMSPEKDQDYFCEGLAEELINALVKSEDLRVASRTSSFRFKGTQTDVREIGRRLNVSTVLEGSVRKAGNHLRITAQLINVADGYNLWSDRYDRELKDVFAIQDEIAGSIVEALQATLSPKEKRAAEKGAPVDVQAYDYYLRGRKYFYEFREKSFQLARQMFTRATVLDEGYARAYAGIADCCSILYMYYDASEENLNEADTASCKAVEIDPEAAEAHASRGLAVSLSGEFEEANKEFEKAIALNPKLFEAHYFYARSLYSQGEMEDAAKRFEEASKVNPEDYQSPLFLAQAYLSLGRRAHASASFRRVVEIVKRHLAFHADDVRALYLGAGALVELGEMELAQRWVDKALAIDPDDPSVLYNVACSYAQLGENEKAIDCLEKSITTGMGQKEWIENDPYFDPLRKHPRFLALLERLDQMSPSSES
jgi:non-specific serine/threonine protein kinase